jgi:hypothetical protein
MVISTSNSPSKLLLPNLPLADWQDTYTTLHLFLSQRLIKYGDRQYDNETNCFTGWNNRNVRL